MDAGLYGHSFAIECGFARIYVYEAYDTSLPGYPKLEERRRLAASTASKLDDIVNTYAQVTWPLPQEKRGAAASRLLNIIIHESADYTSASLFGLLALVQFMACQLIIRN